MQDFLPAYLSTLSVYWLSCSKGGVRDKWKHKPLQEVYPIENFGREITEFDSQIWNPKSFFIPFHNIFSFLFSCALYLFISPVSVRFCLFCASCLWLNWMESIIDKVEKLEIDTLNIAKWSDSEETTKEPLTPVSIDFNPLPLDVSMATPPIKQHTRSASAIYEYAIDSSHPYHHSSPDLKHDVQQNASHNKKKWFQLPRMNLKRQQSTPPRRGFGGLKAGLVEPPEPPPQLLFNLGWSTSLKVPTTLWEDDVKQSASTPVTPVVSRRSSGVYSDTIFSTECNTTRHKKSSSSVSSLSTIVPEQQDNHTPAQLEKDMLAVRRLSCPNYNYQEDGFLDEAGNTASKSKSRSTGTKLFSVIPIHQRPNLKRGISTESVLYHSSPSSSSSSSAVTTPPPSPPLSKNSADYKILLFSVYAPDTNELVLNFRNIQPRTVKLKRRCNLKSEQKALHEWQTQLLTRLKHSFSVQHRDNAIVSTWLSCCSERPYSHLLL